MSFADLVSLLLLGSMAFALVHEMRKADPSPGGLRGHIRARGWGLVLLPAAAAAALMTAHARPLAVLELAVAGALVTWTPRLAASLAPYAVLVLGVQVLVVSRAYHDGFYDQIPYGLVFAGGFWMLRLLLPLAAVLFAFGLWLLVRVDAPGAGLVRALVRRWRDPGRGGIGPAHGLLLIPVTVLALLLMGPRYWFGVPAATVSLVVLLDVALATASLALIFRSSVWAATVAEAGLFVLGGYGLLIASFWPSVPGFVYGFMPLDVTHHAASGGALQGTALLGLGLWFAPRVMREHRASTELTERASQLALVAEAKESSSRALANTTKHAHARSVHIGLRHRGGMLRAEVTDDGVGGASTISGTGLAGVERRLAAFDGILAVNSPPGGPTIVVIEVPCASSSAKTSSC